MHVSMSSSRSKRSSHLKLHFIALHQTTGTLVTSGEVLSAQVPWVCEFRFPGLRPTQCRRGQGRPSRGTPEDDATPCSLQLGDTRKRTGARTGHLAHPCGFPYGFRPPGKLSHTCATSEGTSPLLLTAVQAADCGWTHTGTRAPLRPDVGTAGDRG